MLLLLLLLLESLTVVGFVLVLDACVVLATGVFSLSDLVRTSSLYKIEKVSH